MLWSTILCKWIRVRIPGWIKNLHLTDAERLDEWFSLIGELTRFKGTWRNEMLSLQIESCLNIQDLVCFKPRLPANLLIDFVTTQIVHEDRSNCTKLFLIILAVTYSIELVVDAYMLKFIECKYRIYSFFLFFFFFFFLSHSFYNLASFSADNALWGKSFCNSHLRNIWIACQTITWEKIHT